MNVILPYPRVMDSLMKLVVFSLLGILLTMSLENVFRAFLKKEANC